MQGRIINILGASIIAILAFTTVIGFAKNSDSKQNLNDEKLRSEKLLSEKLLVEKALDKLKIESASLRLRSEENNRKLVAAETKLTDSEKKIRSLSREFSIRSKKEQEHLLRQNAVLEKDYASLLADNGKLREKNSTLENIKAGLESEKHLIQQRLEEEMTYNADNFKIYGTGGKSGKLTFYACRTKNIEVNFDVPQSLSETVGFNITTPSGEMITPANEALNWSLSDAAGTFTADLDGTGETEKSRNISLVYSPGRKLQKGEYKIGIICNGNTIGSCRVQLK